MNILLINSLYFPNMVGGTERSVLLLAENLQKAGHNVYVYTCDGERPLSLETPEIINGVTIFRGYFKTYYNRMVLNKQPSTLDKISIQLKSLKNRRTNKDIKRLIKIIKPDVIHTNNAVGISYWVWKYGKRNGIKVVHALRDYWLLDPSSTIKDSNIIERFLLKLYRGYLRNLTKYVDTVTAPSDYVLNVFKHYNYFKNSQFERVVNSIVLDKDLAEHCVNNKLLCEEKVVTFMFAGNLYDVKGIRELLSTFCKIDNSNIRLTICGDGPLRELVVDAASKDNRISFKGKLDKQHLDVEYNASDVLIVPSVWDEPFGRILIEGAQYGLISVGSNRGGIPEIIDQLKAGICCDVQSEELKKAIVYYSDRQNIKKELPTLKQNLFYYDINKQIADFTAIYKQ